MLTPGLLYFTGAILLLLPVHDRLKYILSFVVTAGALILTYFLLPGSSFQLDFLTLTLVPFKVDPISKLTGLIFAFAGLAAVIYSISVCSRIHLSLIFVFIGSALSVVFSGDLFTLYVFWDLMTISSAFLILLASDVTMKTGYYYFLIHVAGSLSLLWGLFLQYSATGSLSLNAIEEASIPFFMIAIAIKLAFIGFHTWMPLAYSKAPFYVAVVLSIYTTKVGVYVMSRLLSEMHILAYAGLISALFGIVMALRESQVRKFLSYSIIIQVGYMIMGISVGTAEGIAGAIFHLVNHILYKTVLFMAVGVVIYTTGKDHFESLGIMRKKLPVTSIATWVAFLGIAGVPFFNGYMSKTIIKDALHDPVLTWGLNLMSFGTSLMFLKFIYYAFFKNSNVSLEKKPAIGMQLGLGILTVMMLLVGVHPSLLESLTNMHVDIHYFETKHLLSGMKPFLLSILTFILLKKYLVKNDERHPYEDVYRKIAKRFVATGHKLSTYHDGRLTRYLLWAMTTLIILLSLLVF
ncbi:proton-conducting transporter membrane subunit [Cytobacillus sp. FJAT-54145]|uniref:Proton-conducting transporter membrane subunit n=1 Tax=Cytobacillus spartinae TaxID=3299023 RepID=A0ABW6K9J3_9BACI